MLTTEIRKAFLSYFKEHHHTVVPRASLVPQNDPSLLFVNAGMVQFKSYFLGEQAPYSQAVSIQPCLRVGGKHNDLKNVGHTARHHTLFEMLGNFSFGEYFKKEAITFAWYFITEHLKIPVSKLCVTVHDSDQESRLIWENEIGLPRNKVIDCGDEDNFWSMGDTGPCGPCTEIFYDHGPEVPGGPPGSKDADGDRFVEIWNLVFMSYERLANGDQTPLPNPCVDTGMGLERIAAVLQSVHSNYETDVFQFLMDAVAQCEPSKSCTQVTLQVVADHLRSILFLMTDGVIPGNEGRSYVLRRIIRRALRYLYQDGFNSPCLFKMLPAVAAIMGEDYPELKLQLHHHQSQCEKEEIKFFNTLDQGMSLLHSHLDHHSHVAGDVIFKLYDTYGFPVDLTEDIVSDHNGTLDLEGYEQCMKEQKERSKQHQKFKDVLNYDVSGLMKTQFLGYEVLASNAKVVRLYQKGESIDQCQGEAEMIVDRTPCYPEGGGQIGDCADLFFGDEKIGDVVDTRTLGDQIIHYVRLLSVVHVNDDIRIVVSDARHQTAPHHSATHLLHATLKNVLGEHVCQKGSLVTSEKLRFDYSHDQALTAIQQETIEQTVNDMIRQSIPVQTKMMSLDEAKAEGAICLFGEKYPDRVRVLSIGDFSKELCGGTHVSNTNQLIVFKLLSDSALSSGVRRIEAIAGIPALNYLNQQSKYTRSMSRLLKVGESNIEQKVSQLMAENRKLEKQLKQKQAHIQVTMPSESINGCTCFIAQVSSEDERPLVQYVDQNRGAQKMVSFFYEKGDETARFVIGVGKDLVQQISAKEIMTLLSKHLKIKGGGKDLLIQGVISATPEDIKHGVVVLKQWIKEFQF
ncbi:MAG: alanine--tRNA ligase [Legionellales bacterium]|nr:alanine--tRNA ligase [Legionellales bacterium]